MDFNDKIIKRIEDEAAVWIMKQDSVQDCRIEDDMAFQKWLNQSKQHQVIFRGVQKIWQDLDFIEPYLSENIEFDNDNTIDKQPQMLNTQSTQFFGFYKVSAMFAMIFLIFGISYNSEFVQSLYADNVSSIGEIKHIYLTDGSEIIMNSNSALNIEMTENLRKFTLIKGEASFYVAKDKKRPFIVSSGKNSAKALGTIFMVRKNNDDMIISVIESRVEVSNGKSQSILNEGEKILIDADGNLSKVQNIDIIRTKAWERGKIIFEDTPLSEVIDVINNHYTGFIRVIDPEIQNLKVNGVFKLKNPVALVDLLEESLKLRSIRLTNHVIFLHK